MSACNRRKFLLHTAALAAIPTLRASNAYGRTIPFSYGLCRYTGTVLLDGEYFTSPPDKVVTLRKLWINGRLRWVEQVP